MPIALATTKRKFHRLLDSISNASSTSLATNHERNNASTATLPASLVHSAKKARVDRPRSAYPPPSERAVTKPRPVSQLPTANRPTTATNMDEEHKSPNFAPWDRGRFLERLKTYRHVDKWLGKPDKINEVEWAKRGWSCVGKETVRCVGGCDSEVVIKLEDDVPDLQREGGDKSTKEEEEEEEWREEAQKQLVEKYTEMIPGGHDGGCLWRRRGCDGRDMAAEHSLKRYMTDLSPDTIHRLPLAHQAAALEGLLRRYQSLTAMASDLPTTISTPQGFENTKLVEIATSTLMRRTSPDPSAQTPAKVSSKASTHASYSQSDVNTSALTLALFGWQAEEGHISGLATCTACFRRLGLWLFKPPGDDPDSQSSMDRLDVVGEHRDYCPWINTLSQNGVSRRSSLDGLAGWEVLYKHVRNNAIYKRDSMLDTRADAEKENADAAREAGSAINSDKTAEEDKAAMEQKDQERWARLKRLKQVFQVKRKSGSLKTPSSVR
ncbi:MAG: hypothetical protein Q9217_001646 [Psora testacea]